LTPPLKSGDHPKINANQLARTLIFDDSTMVLHGFCWFWDVPGRPQIHEISTLGSHGEPKVAYGSICVASGSFRCDIWELLGAIWELLGVIRELLGAICELLGDIWQLPNDIWERLGEIWELRGDISELFL